jgi:serine/threonine protein kinase
MINNSIPRCIILENLIESGMGVVHKAEDTKLNREAAIKVLSPYLPVPRVDRALFNREAKPMTAQQYPGRMIFSKNKYRIY